MKKILALTTLLIIFSFAQTCKAQTSSDAQNITESETLVSYAVVPAGTSNITPAQVARNVNKNTQGPVPAVSSVSVPKTTSGSAILPAANSSPVSRGTDFSQTYKTSSENLLYLLLSALNDVNYTIEEIQFKTGNVLFKAYSKEFLASVASQDGYNSFINIIPVDNNYNFQPWLIEKLHKYIDVNNNINFRKVL